MRGKAAVVLLIGWIATLGAAAPAPALVADLRAECESYSNDNFGYTRDETGCTAEGDVAGTPVDADCRTFDTESPYGESLSYDGCVVNAGDDGASCVISTYDRPDPHDPAHEAIRECTLTVDGETTTVPLPLP